MVYNIDIAKSISHSLTMQMGETALHGACRRKKLELAKWLAELMNREAIVSLNQVREALP